MKFKSRKKPFEGVTYTTTYKRIRSKHLLKEKEKKRRPATKNFNCARKHSGLEVRTNCSFFVFSPRDFRLLVKCFLALISTRNKLFSNRRPSKIFMKTVLMTVSTHLSEDYSLALS